MSVVLTGRCERKRHIVFTVEEVAGEYVVCAPRVAVGRERETWTPGSRPIDPARTQRYGCACGRSELLSDKLMLDDIRRGETEWVIAGSNVSARRRSGMGKHASG
jgi:hypothetical protein